MCFPAQRPERPTPPRRRGASGGKNNAAPTLFSSRRFCYLGRIATNIDHDIAATGKEHWPREISYRGFPARRGRFAPPREHNIKSPRPNGNKYGILPGPGGLPGRGQCWRSGQRLATAMRLATDERMRGATVVSGCSFLPSIRPYPSAHPDLSARPGPSVRPKYYIKTAFCILRSWRPPNVNEHTLFWIR